MKCYVWERETISIEEFKVFKKGNPLIGNRRLSDEEWKKLEPFITPHLLQKTRFDIYKDGENIEYLPIKIPSNNYNELLDDDLQRSFEQGVRNTQELTRSKFSKFIKVGVVFLVVLFSVGGFLLFMVMLNKGQVDFASKFAGIAQKGLNLTKVFGG